MGHALPAPGALVPLSAAQATAVAAVAKAFGASGEPTPPHAAWRPFDPSRATLLLFPSDERAAVGGPLAAAGLTLLLEEVRLEAAPPAAGGARPGPRGLLDAWGPDPARAILAQDEGATRAAAARELDEEARGVLERALAEPCALGAGELLETTVGDGPVARSLARAHGHRAEPGRLADLVRLLRFDAGAVAGGVTPLARAFLGGALWSAVRQGLPVDEQVEGALADLALAEGGAAPAPLPGPLDAPPPLDPVACLGSAGGALVDGLRRLARGEPAELPKPLPSGLASTGALPARLADLGALSRGGPDGLAAAARLGSSLDAAALDPDALVAVALGDHHAGRPGPERRARLRRLAAGLPADRAPAALAAAVALVPDLQPVDGLVRAALAAPPADREAALAQVHARLGELAGEERALSAPEVARARLALGAAGPGDGDLLDLALAAAEGATDLAARATKAVVGWAAGRAPAHAVAPALDVLARAGVEPFDPARASPRELELLCHLAAARRASGKEPAPALLSRLAARDAGAWGLTPDAAAVEPAAVARLLGAALPREQALALAATLAAATRKVSLSAPGAPEGARPLLVGPRDEARWDAVEGGRPATVVVVEEPRAAPLLERQAALLRAAAAAKPPVPLELPTRAVSADALGLGPGRAGLVAPRVAGTRLPPSLAALAEVAAALATVHAAGLALGADPLLAARRLPAGGLGFAAGDASALVDPARRAALQADDVRRVAARADALERSAAGSGAADRAPATDVASLAKALAARAAEPARAALERDAWLDLDTDASALLEDALLGRGPVTPADARHQLGLLGELFSDDDARDLLLGLGEAGAASGRFALLVEPDGRFALTAPAGGPQPAGAP